MVQRQQVCEESKNEYASELQKTNTVQHEHYEVIVPQVFQVSYLLSSSSSHNELSIGLNMWCCMLKEICQQMIVLWDY